MSRRASITNQVDRIFKAMFEEGQSRHQAKRAGTARRKVFSYATRDTYRERCLTLLNSLGAEKPRMLRDLRPEHIQRGVALMHERGVSSAHIKTTLAAFRKLAVGLHQRQWNPLTALELVPDTLYRDLARSTARGGYRPEHVTQLRTYVSTQIDSAEMLRMFDLLTASGLRRREVAKLQEAHIDRETGQILVARGKGGRQRTIGPGLDDTGHANLRTAIDAIPEGRHWLWTSGDAVSLRLRKTIRAGCAELGIAPKGIHGLRASFAEDFLLRRMDAGLSEPDARRELSRQLGHNRIDVTYRYVPRL